MLRADAWFRTQELEDAQPVSLAPRVMLVSDDPLRRRAIARQLAGDGYELCEVRGLEELAARLDLVVAANDNTQPAEVLILDIGGSASAALELLDGVRAFDSGLAVILLSPPGGRLAYGDIAVAVLEEPFELDDLRHVVTMVSPP
jgi:DNA-binding response OmpR family regulator